MKGSSLKSGKKFIYIPFILLFMTIIVGAAYSDGLVMASDLLAIAKNGMRTEERKIDYAEKLMWGLAGKFDSRISGVISRGIKALRQERTIEELVDLLLGQLVSEVNDRIGATYQNEPLFHTTGIWGVLGAVYKDEFGIWYCDGRKLIRKDANVVVASPHLRGFGMNFGALNYEEASRLAIAIVGKMNSSRPEKCSGLNAVHLTKSGAEEIIYEPIRPQ